MAARRSYTPPSRAQSRYNTVSTQKYSENYPFRIQSAPPLSIQQYARLHTRFLPYAQQWEGSGHSRPVPFHSYAPVIHRARSYVPREKSWSYSYKQKYVIPTYSLKHYKDISPPPVGPVWNPPGRYVDKRPTSFSPERRPQPVIQEPVWKPPGHYKAKEPRALSPEKRPQPVIREPVWCPPGRFKEKRPTSLSPEKRPQEPRREPVWCPTSKFQHKPVPYFDPPNLRWSLNDLVRSMPEMRPEPLRASRSATALRRSYDQKINQL